MNTIISVLTTHLRLTLEIAGVIALLLLGVAFAAQERKVGADHERMARLQQTETAAAQQLQAARDSLKVDTVYVDRIVTKYQTLVRRQDSLLVVHDTVAAAALVPQIAAVADTGVTKACPAVVRSCGATVTWLDSLRAADRQTIHLLTTTQPTFLQRHWWVESAVSLAAGVVIGRH